MRDLDTKKKKTYGASVGRCGPEPTLFHASTQGQIERKLFSITEKKRPLIAKEVLGTTQGVKNICTMGAKKRSYSREEKIHEELDGL